MILALYVELEGRAVEQRRFPYPQFAGDAPELILWDGQIYRRIPALEPQSSPEFVACYVLEVVFSPASGVFVDQVFEPVELAEFVAAGGSRVTEDEVARQSFGLAFRRLRATARQTMGDAARYLGVRVAEISAWEHGATLPRPGLVERWIDHLQDLPERAPADERAELLDLWTSAFTCCRGCGSSFEACRPLWVSTRKCCPDCSHSMHPTRGDLLAALGEAPEAFAFGVTIRRCLTCGEPVTGGPTRCLGCASRTLETPGRCATCGKRECRPERHAGVTPEDR